MTRGFIDALIFSISLPFALTALLVGVIYEACKQSFLCGRIAVLQMLQGILNG